MGPPAGMLFRTCFCATVREVEGSLRPAVASRFDLDGTGIPPEANLLDFCFPLGMASMVAREYQASEV